MMAPYEEEIAPHRFEELRAIGRITLRPRDVNWKNVADNYSDGLHINVAHPGLTRLFGGDYGIEAGAHVDRMSGELVERPSTNLSERAYQHFLPKAAGRTWLYFKLWPNVAFDIYPDQVDFMHFVPVGPTETMIREISYALARRPPRDEGGALSQLADQPAGQRRGHGADPPGPAGHGLRSLPAGAAGEERGLPAQLRAEAQAADPGGAAGVAAAARLERFIRRMSQIDRHRRGGHARLQRLASIPAP